jgi:hypothetical protein
MDNVNKEVVEFYKKLGYTLIDIKSSVFREEESTLVFQTDNKNHTVDGSTILYDHAVSIHQELQKAREERKGWKGYLVVDPETDNYTYSDVYLNRIDAEKWLKANGISGLKIIEVDVYQSDLDQ